MKRSTSWLLLCMLTLVTIPTVMAQPNYNYSKLQREKLGRGVIAIRENPSEVVEIFIFRPDKNRIQCLPGRQETE